MSPCPPHLPQFSIINELWTVSMDERTETQTVFPAETEKLMMKQCVQKNGGTFESIYLVIKKNCLLRHFKTLKIVQIEQRKLIISWQLIHSGFQIVSDFNGKQN